MQNFRKIFFIVSFFSTTLALAGPIEGVLLERGTRKPLANVNIFILPSTQKTTTAEDGSFKFETVPEGVFQWIVNLTGYEKLEQNFEVTPENAHDRVKLYLEKSSYQVYETTIVDKAQKRDAGTKTIRAKQSAGTPGSGGDAIKGVQNMPGVNRPFSFQSQVVIQGSGPQDTRYQVDGHEVPLIFHFGGLNSVLWSEALDRIDFLSAGYGPEYGRATGGLISVYTREPQKDRAHGIAYVDLLNAGGMIETPIGKKSSALLGFRQSYIGNVLGLVAKNNPSFNLTVAPKYTDILGIFNSELMPKGDFKLTALASQDSLGFVLKEPVEEDPTFRGDFDSKTSFVRLIPQFTYRHSESTATRYSLGLGRDWIKFVNGDNYFHLATYAITARTEVETKVNSFWTTYLGIDDRHSWAKVAVSFPSTYFAGGVANPISSGTKRKTTVSTQFNQVGVYSRNVLSWPGSDWTFLPNLRTDYFVETKEFLPAPRPAVTYQLTPSLKLRSASGIYYQPPQEGEIDPTFGNPNLKSPRAWHVTLGGEKDFRNGRSDGFTTSADLFYKYLDRQVIPSTTVSTTNGKLVPENYNNNGMGQVYGAQTQVRFDREPYALSIAYTLSRSTRWQPGRDEYPFSYDQTHLLGVIGSVNVGNWKFSSRFRYSTGNPTTPVTGATFDADNDVFIPRRGAFYSERLSPFAQLDIRIDKKWVYDAWILSIYLDIQNVTNRKNSESIIYSYDYTQTSSINGFPILPTFGVKGEF